MRFFAGALFLFFFTATQAQADTLVLKSGESKKGKVVEETESLVLFKQEDGLVVEVPRSKVSILDKDPATSGPTKGAVNVFSESPNKKPYKLLAIGDGVSPVRRQEEPVRESGGLAKKLSDQGMSFEAMSGFVERWLAEHPEIEEKMKDLLHKSQSQSDQLNQMVDTVEKT